MQSIFCNARSDTHYIVSTTCFLKAKNNSHTTIINNILEILKGLYLDVIVGILQNGKIQGALVLSCFWQRAMEFNLLPSLGKANLEACGIT